MSAKQPIYFTAKELELLLRTLDNRVAVIRAAQMAYPDQTILTEIVDVTKVRLKLVEALNKCVANGC